MKAIIVILLLGCFINSTYGADAVCTPDAGKCCCDATTNDPLKATGVATCATSPCESSAANNMGAATCAANYSFGSATCTACVRGYEAGAGTTATCSLCAQDQISTAAAAGCGSKTGTPTGALLNCRVFGEAGATTCIIAKDGYGLSGTDPVECAQDQWSANGSACAAATTPVTGVTNCKAYTSAAATACAVAKAGYYLASATSVPACIDNCATCTGNTAALCTSAQPGYYIKDDAGTKSLAACIANCDVCTGDTVALCTTQKVGFWIKGDTTKTIEPCAVGCYSCALDAADTTQMTSKCAKAQQGYSISAAFAVARCADGKTTASDNHSLDTCATDCVTGSACKSCIVPAECDSCALGSILGTSPKTCTVFDQATIHGSCDKGVTTTADGCQSCQTAHNREMEKMADPASTATPPAMIAKVTGKCVCKTGYGDKSGLATPDFVCAACGTTVANYETCTFGTDGKLTAVTCATGFFKAGLACYAQTDAVDGFFFDTSLTTSAFVACPTCKSCSAAAKCLTCMVSDVTNWIAPNSTNTTYATLLKGINKINDTCVDKCPTGFSANTDRSNCVSPALSPFKVDGGAGGSSFGVFSIVGLLIAVLSVF